MKLIKTIITTALISLSIQAYALSVNNVTASGYDEKGGHKPEYIIDGSIKTRWAAQGDSTWIAVEFAKKETINNFVIVPFKANERNLNFTISYSDDGKNWTNINGQYETSLSSNKNGEKFIFDKPIKAKFFRLNTLGTNINKWSAIIEVKFNSDDILPSQPVK